MIFNPKGTHLAVIDNNGVHEIELATNRMCTIFTSSSEVKPIKMYYIDDNRLVFGMKKNKSSSEFEYLQVLNKLTNKSTYINLNISIKARINDSSVDPVDKVDVVLNNFEDFDVVEGEILFNISN